MPTPDDYNNQPGYRNFNAPPGTPGYFTVANPSGGPPLPNRTTESSTRNGNGAPQATQVAAAPPPVDGGVTPEAMGYTPEEIAGAKARGMIGQNGLPAFPPGTVKFNSQGVPYNPQRVGEGGVTPPEHPFPTPDQAAPPPEPAAKPLPNLGAWTPDQAKPWMHARVIPPQAVPNRAPDTHVGTRPAYQPRPTEPGYAPQHQPGQPYSFAEQLGFALQAGFTGQAAYTAAALGMAESKGNAGIVHYNDGGKGFNSYGLLQINGSNDAALRAAGINGASAAVDPLTSYKAGYIISKGGTDFNAWTTFRDGSYKQFLDPNAQPAASSSLVVGPRQAYRPSVEREPGQWGSTPERDWTPGNMPTAHDFPSILGALLPIAIAGVLGGGGLGMIAAFTGYQNARNKAQQEEAKEQKTKWKDALEETTSRLKLQLLGAKGIFAEYGDLNDPRAKQELLELALKTDDKQLLSAVENGDMNAVGHLLNTRDKIFQDLSKTKDAQDRADTELAEKERKANEVNAGLGLPPQPVREPGGGVEPTQQPFFPEGGAPGPAPAAAPEQPAAPAPSAPQQPPAAGGRPTPPAAGQPAAPAPSPAEGAPQEPAPPPPAGGEPSSTLPPVGVSAPTADDPLARLTPQEQAIARDVLAGGEMPKFPPEAAASETRIESAVAGLNQKLRQVSDNPNLKDENAVISQVRRVDPLTGDNLAAIAHNQMPLPGSESGTSGSGGSRGVMGYRNLMSNLARKVNPQWDPGQWGGIEKFRDPSGLTQRSIGRITAIGDAGTKLQEDLKHIPDNPTQFQRQLDQFLKQGFTDDPAYSNLFTDWQTFIIDSNALTQGGQGLEGETEQMIKSIPMYGQKSAYEGALKRHASFALSRYQQYQNQWSQLQRTDAMFGHNDVAEKQIRDLANIKEGGPGGMPQVGPGGEGYDQVPKGGQYIGPDGKTYTKG